MDEQQRRWRANDADDFWGSPAVAKRLAADTKAESDPISSGWRRIAFAALAAALVLSTVMLLTAR